MDEDRKPIAKKKGAKLKSVVTTVLSVFIGLAIAAGAITGFYYFVDGASSPEDAVSEYTKAAMIYDADNMIRYSSEYNKVVLYGNSKTSDRLLKAYLKNAYATKQSEYKEEDISFELISSDIYESGTSKYAEVIEKYENKANPDGIKAICLVRLNVINGESKQSRTLVAVKKGLRWYFAYAQ